MLNLSDSTYNEPGCGCISALIADRMTARKLSDTEKQDILQLYRTTGETSSTLATRYGVSTSTVSRLLKSSLPVDEYEALIQQKRSLRGTDSAADSIEQPEQADEQLSIVADAEIAPIEVVEPEPEPEPQPEPEPIAPARSKPILRRSRQTAPAEASEAGYPLEVGVSSSAGADAQVKAEPSVAEAEVLKEILAQNLIEPEDELSDDLDDLDEDDEDDEDDDFEADGNQPFLVSGRLKEGYTVQILPLADAPIPRTCYLVVDRAAELIAPPLRDFGDLGQIPEAEVQAKTLPVFDNHRIAKRYSNPRTQRVIKLPDGRILSKTSSHLRAKGITHLLIDGRVYSLN